VPKLKNTLLIIIFAPIGIFFGAIMLIAAIPFVVFFMFYNLYLKLFTILRNDPKVAFEKLVDRAKIKDTQTLDGAINYFETLTDTIARESKATISTTKKSVEDPDDDYDVEFNNKILVYDRVITSKFATVRIDMKILEMTRDDGEIFYASANDDEDPELASIIIATIRFKSEDMNCKCTVGLEFDDVGAYFCIGILRGDGEYDQRTSQSWSHLTDKDVWIVKYDDDGRNFGLRKSRVAGRARERWFDEQV
jgi:hypothetical protein